MAKQNPNIVESGTGEYLAIHDGWCYPFKDYMTAELFLKNLEDIHHTYNLKKLVRYKYVGPARRESIN